MGLLAQHAYGKSQKIEIGLSNNSLSGIILSPKAEMPERMEEYIAEMQARNVEMYFDPQFYICAFEGDIGCGKLDKYNFYPEGIINKKYLSIPSNIQDIVKRNIEYQKKCNMKTIISPNIFFESFDSRMSQIALSLANESIRYMESENIMISICVHESAFANFEDVKDFLDIITLFEVEGFYVIIERNNYNTPNMIDSDSMASQIYKELPEEYFETKSKSSHLKVWDDGLKRFEEMLKDI